MNIRQPAFSFFWARALVSLAFISGAAFFLLFSCASGPDRSPASSAGQKLVLVFAGPGYQIPSFLGMLEALEEAGIHPAYIVASGGGSFAAALAKRVPSSAARKEFLRSEAFRQFLNLSPHKAREAASLYNSEAEPDGGRRKKAAEWQVPYLFHHYAFETPAPNLLPGADPGLSGGDTHYVFLSTRVNFQSKDEGRSDFLSGAVFTETYFTDPETAAILSGQPSGAKISNLPSKVGAVVEVRDADSLNDALMASLADSYYFPPYKIGDEHFTGGAANPFPLSLAKRLAGTVVFPFQPRGDSNFESEPYTKMLGFAVPKYRSIVMHQPASYWVDFSDAEKWKKSVEHIYISGVEHWSLPTAVPADRESYIKYIDTMWSYGHERMAEALKQYPVGDKTHLRSRQ